MKKHLHLFAALILLSFFTSCSTEDINQQDTSLLGVWESSVNSTETQILVFGDNNTGLSIQENVYDSGESTSSAIPFKWESNDDVVTLVENDMSPKNYVVNSEGELVLSSSQDLRLVKVSDDYSKYY